MDQANKILLVSHKNPDSDACGSVLSLYGYLKSINKEVAIFLYDQPPAYLDFLHNYHQIKSDYSVLYDDYDVVVFLDTADLDHAQVSESDLTGKYVINIDHHVSNTNYGHINLVAGSASSACEVLYYFFQTIGYHFDKKIANCLLVGILSDTGGFTNTATSVESMEISSDLLRHGANLPKITSQLIRTKSLNGLRLWGLVLSRFKINKKFDLIHTYITEADLKKFKVVDEEIAGLANFLNVVADVSVAMLFQVYPDKLKVNLRTTKDDVRVDKLAQFFGGGGHKKAAGFTVLCKVKEDQGHLQIID